jgi:hypothetical protein
MAGRAARIENAREVAIFTQRVISIVPVKARKLIGRFHLGDEARHPAGAGSACSSLA